MNGYVVILPGLVNKILAFLASALLLCLLGAFSSNIGSPASNCLDWPSEDYCVVSTYCQAGPGSRLRFRATDLLATSTVELAVILCWFGTYELVVDLVELPGLPVPVECSVCLGNSQICRSTISLCLISFSNEGISSR